MKRHHKVLDVSTRHLVQHPAVGLRFAGPFANEEILIGVMNEIGKVLDI